ncbi:YitT family protein [uncultured Veillonella sp.]|uniref:YitT family protein n=1 Tax=uncultured Veillonella sp. TaxID=159268 RepID=UPI0025DAA52E|nr:YitT family protein [uncultured Veillonella sp.]
MFAKYKDVVYQCLMVVVGCAIFGAGIDAFVLPHKLVSTGISGVGLILYYITGLSVGSWNMILNIPIFWAAWKWLGTRVVVKTLYGTLMLSWMIDVFDFLQYDMIIKDPLLSSMMAGITTGVGLGIVYRVGGNTGGLDPIALIVRKYYGLQMGSINSAINCAILLAAVGVVGLEAVAVTLISVYVYTILTNKVVIGFNQRKVAFIITYRTDEVCECIINKVGRGATIIEGVGAYTRTPKNIVMVAVNLLQVNKLKEVIEEADPNVFILITDAQEVIGQGFTRPILPIEVTNQMKAQSTIAQDATHTVTDSK